MYEYIDFNMINNEEISDFLRAYNYNDFTLDVWQKLTNRIKYFNNENISIRHKYYVKSFFYQENSESQ